MGRIGAESGSGQRGSRALLPRLALLLAAASALRPDARPRDARRGRLRGVAPPPGIKAAASAAAAARDAADSDAADCALYYDACAWAPVLEMYDVRCAVMDAVEENTVVRLKTLVRQSNDIPKLYRNLTPDQLLPRWREARDRVLAGGSAAPARDAADALALPAKWLGFVDDLSPRLEQQLVSAAVSDESRRVTVELLGVFEAELACLKTDALRRAARRTMERRGETLEGARKRYGLSADASENDVIDCFLELPLGLWAPAAATLGFAVLSVRTIFESFRDLGLFELLPHAAAMYNTLL